MRWRFVFAMALLAICGRLFGFSGGAPLRVTGAPGDSTCTNCHGRVPNGAGGSLTIEPVDRRDWLPGEEVRLRVTLREEEARRWGFVLTARQGDGDLQRAGSFHEVPGDGSTQSLDGGESITQTLQGTRDQQRTSVSWEVLWRAPQTEAAFVRFYAAGNAANGDGDFGVGDKIYTAVLAIPRRGATLPGRWVLPRVAAGQGWTTQVDLTNPGAARASWRLTLFDERGQPMAVDGSATREGEASPGATVRVNLRGGVALQGGWADLEIPDGFLVQATLRQMAGGTVQEAAVLAQPKDALRWIGQWDESAGVTTRLVLLNPGPADAEVRLIFRQPSGEASPPLIQRVGAQSQSIVAPSEAAALSGGHGWWEVSSSAAAIVFGLRFQDSGAFSTLPARVER